MKNILDRDADSGAIDGEKFVVRRLEGELQQKLQRTEEELSRLEKRASLPQWLGTIVASFPIVGFLSFIFALMKLLKAEEPLTGTLKTTMIVIASVGGGLIAISVAFCIFGGIRRRRFYRSGEYRIMRERQEKVEAECREFLGVPESASEIDAFSRQTKIKNGQKKVYTFVSKFSYINVPVLVYRDEFSLYVAVFSAVLKIPFDAAPRLERIERRTAFYGWNKDTGLDFGRYKQYKIRTNNTGAYTIKPLFALRFFAEGEEYEFVVPAYEYATLSRLTGQTA